MIRKLLPLLIVGGALIVFSNLAFALQSLTDQSPTPIEVIETGKAAWSALSVGKWSLGLGLALTVIVQLFRAQWTGALLESIPRRWRVSIPLALSGVASALLYLAGQMPPELAALCAPVVAGVAIGTHEVGEALFARRPRYRAGDGGLLSLFIIGVFIGGCTIRPPMQTMTAGLTASERGDIVRVEVAAVDDRQSLLTWCRTRQERRWWSSALAQAAGVLAGGLVAAALARDDDRVELGLEISGLLSTGFAAGAQSYSGAQAGAYEQYCNGVMQP